MSKVAELNDAFRSGNRPDLGRIMITSGVRDLVSPHPLGIVPLYAKIQRFNTFTEDNDPYGEHDFGSLEHAGAKVFWKIDYYDKTMEAGSEDPADPTKTTRVLTVMLAEEY